MRVIPYQIGPTNFSGAILSFLDLTRIRLAERALTTSQEDFSTLFDTMSQGVVYQRRDGQIISANGAAQRLLGLTLDQLMGRTSIDRRWRSMRPDGSPFPGEEHPAMVALETGKVVSDVIMGVYTPVEDRTRWINITAVPLFKEGEEAPTRSTLSSTTSRSTAASPRRSGQT